MAEPRRAPQDVPFAELAARYDSDAASGCGEALGALRLGADDLTAQQRAAAGEREAEECEGDASSGASDSDDSGVAQALDWADLRDGDRRLCAPSNGVTLCWVGIVLMKSGWGCNDDSCRSPLAVDLESRGVLNNSGARPAGAGPNAQGGSSVQGPARKGMQPKAHMQVA